MGFDTSGKLSRGRVSMDPQGTVIHWCCWVPEKSGLWIHSLEFQKKSFYMCGREGVLGDCPFFEVNGSGSCCGKAILKNVFCFGSPDGGFCLGESLWRL